MDEVEPFAAILFSEIVDNRSRSTIYVHGLCVILGMSRLEEIQIKLPRE